MVQSDCTIQSNPFTDHRQQYASHFSMIIRVCRLPCEFLPGSIKDLDLEFEKSPRNFHEMYCTSNIELHMELLYDITWSNSNILELSIQKSILKVVTLLPNKTVPST
jgi:hypothetical protein